MPLIDSLKDKLNELGAYCHALNVLGWDEKVHMPKKGAQARSQATSVLASQQHRLFTSPEFSTLITELNEEAKQGKLSADERCIVENTWRDFNIAKKRSASFVERKSQAESMGYAAWAEAREKNDFSIFAPHLKTLVDLAREDAAQLGFQKTSYNALIDLFEPETTVDDIDPLIQNLKDFLVPFVKERISKQKTARVIKGKFPKEKQEQLAKEIISAMGFDFEAGRIDETVHPFCATFAIAADVRITTRYTEDDLLYSLSSTIHEAGHALYQQNLPEKHAMTPLADYVSMGIHESQSRLWENIVGKSRTFWRHWFPRAQELFPEALRDVSFEDFYNSINTVTPSFIRTEADEVTYNLHIIIRYEIEKALIEGSIEVDDLPELWADKYEEYLGIRPKTFSEGVLQDVHWSNALFGYFPTYALGNLYSAQFYAAAKKSILNLEEEIGKGYMQHLKNWLGEQIHQHGKRYTAPELVQKVTGEPLSATAFIDYLKNKYQ